MKPDSPVVSTGPATRGVAHRARLRLRLFVRRYLSWSQLYRASTYLNSALWCAPLVGILLIAAAMPFLRRLDLWLGWGASEFDLAGAQTLCQTVITLNSSFVVFTFGSLLVAIQVAGAQLTPRIIATMLLSDRVVRYSVSLYVGTLVLAVAELNRLGGQVPQLLALLTSLLGVASIASFLFLIDYAARLLRPVSVLGKLGTEGIRVIEALYPREVVAVPMHEEVRRRAAAGTHRVLTHAGRSEILLAIDLPRLVEQATRHHGTIELLPQIGDFVSVDAPLFALYGGAAGIDDAELRTMAATGRERTFEQDPMFVFRIIVDIALKALSPAINDPTTAVLAIDQIHRLLRVLGLRSLRGEVIADAAGIPRVIFRTPNWEDFVRVGCQEIRTCGIASIQIPRRLRAMLEDLLHILPEHRHAVMHEELALLDRMCVARYAMAEDLALARMPDAQGLGGAAPRRTLVPLG